MKALSLFSKSQSIHMLFLRIEGSSSSLFLLIKFKNNTNCVPRSSQMTLILANGAYGNGFSKHPTVNLALWRNGTTDGLHTIIISMSSLYSVWVPREKMPLIMAAYYLQWTTDIWFFQMRNFPRIIFTRFVCIVLLDVFILKHGSHNPTHPSHFSSSPRDTLFDFARSLLVNFPHKWK